MKKKLSVRKSNRVLVVGTTADYIDWIRKAFPDRALFLTDHTIRQTAVEDSPQRGEEICCFLEDGDQVKADLDRHLEKWDQVLSGVACFDCESMMLASRLASAFNLPYPSIEAIGNCRDKYVSKQIWQQNHIPCPLTRPINTLEEVTRFLELSPGGVVLKPFFGSGSELVFKCKILQECQQAFETIRQGLLERKKNPLFTNQSAHTALMVAEAFIDGTEYSCDFMVNKQTVTIIRMTRKIKSDHQPFGTISGYLLLEHLPGQARQSTLEAILLAGANSLGIKQGICMVDFIFKDHQPVLIEMTPRPGGDCLPFLLKEAGNLDILGLTLDVAEKKPLNLTGSIPFKPCIGIRIHAHKAGVLKRLNTDQLKSDTRVKKRYFIRKPGHVITMPPDDYDSWLLGHMIIEPDDTDLPETQCFMIADRIGVDIE